VNATLMPARKFYAICGIWRLSVVATGLAPMAFSSEVGTGSREESDKTIKQKAIASG
jgi:hypothetical protein